MTANTAVPITSQISVARMEECVGVENKIVGAIRLIHFKNCFVETGKYFSVSTVHSVTGDNEDHDGLWSEQRHLRYGDVGLGIVFELCVNRV